MMTVTITGGVGVIVGGGAGVSVGGNAVGTGVFVGGNGVLVGGDVAVGGAVVAVGGIVVAVGGTVVIVGKGVHVGGGAVGKIGGAGSVGNTAGVDDGMIGLITCGVAVAGTLVVGKTNTTVAPGVGTIVCTMIVAIGVSTESTVITGDAVATTPMSGTRVAGGGSPLALVSAKTSTAASSNSAKPATVPTSSQVARGIGPPLSTSAGVVAGSIGGATRCVASAGTTGAITSGADNAAVKAAANAPALAGRRSGFFSSARITASPTARDTFGFTTLRCGGNWSTCWRAIATSLSPSNGCRPLSAKYAVTPSE